MMYADADAVSPSIRDAEYAAAWQVAGKKLWQVAGGIWWVAGGSA